MHTEKFFTSGALFALICLGMYLCFICRSFKILDETKNRFFFQIRPTFSWAVGIFFGAIGFLFILSTLISPPITILTCNHSFPESSVNQHYPSCQLVAISWLGTEQNKTLIVKLQAALLEAQLDANDDSSLFDRYQVVLVTDVGNIPFIESYTYSSLPEYQHLLTVVSQINSFVTKPLQDSLIVEKDEKDAGYICFAIGTFFSLITFLILAISPYITCSFEREFNKVTIERRNLFGKKTFEYKISDVVAVKVEEQSDIESATYRLTLLLTSGEKVPLTYDFTSGWKEKQQIANQLKNFLAISNPRADL